MARRCRSDWNLKPTMHQEITFLKDIYDGTVGCKARKRLEALFERNGYRIRQVVEIHGEVKCCFFTPKSFPVNREEVRRRPPSSFT